MTTNTTVNECKACNVTFKKQRELREHCATPEHGARVERIRKVEDARRAWDHAHLPAIRREGGYPDRNEGRMVYHLWSENKDIHEDTKRLLNRLESIREDLTNAMLRIEFGGAADIRTSDILASSYVRDVIEMSSMLQARVRALSSAAYVGGYRCSATSDALEVAFNDDLAGFTVTPTCQLVHAAYGMCGQFDNEDDAIIAALERAQAVSSERIEQRRELWKKALKEKGVNR